jgi:membrane protease YdiL (CAAX protease family)
LCGKKIRLKLEPFEFPRISKSPPLILFFLWMIVYLGFWRASPQDFFIPQTTQLKEYLLSNSIGGFFLSELTEEIAYRGVLLLLLLKAGFKPGLSIIIQATIFVMPHYIGLAHGQMDMIRTLSTFLLGAVFGWSMLAYRGLAMPIALHVLWNFISKFTFIYVE